jgi:hypothetical protein
MGRLPLASCVLKDGPVTENILVMPGSDRRRQPALHAIAADFGWTVEVTNDLKAIAAAQPSGKTVAALFSRDALGPGYSWLKTIQTLKIALPKTHLVVCHGFSETIDWPELSDAGAFHELWLPLQDNEARLCLGFVWEAEKRLASPAVPQTVPVPALEKTQPDKVQRMPSGRIRHLHGTNNARAAR